MYTLRGLGGTIYLAGAVLMVVNLVKTIRAGKFVESEEAEAPALRSVPMPEGKVFWHSVIERKPVRMLVLSLVVVGIGGAIELIPTFLVKSNIPSISTVKPYTPLELQGRDIYIREGCYTCHSQMIRPFRDEVARYGDYSKSGEFVYDHPFQWGSKRTGPDLARIGGKYPNSWHYHHMDEPQLLSQGSIMPSYSWLLENTLDISTTPGKIRAMQTLGVPYPAGYDKTANDDLKSQADEIVANLKKDKINTTGDKEIIALIAYLQRMGTDIKKAPEKEVKDLH
jgi:cytochrome c oxidase cbb3-type subunit I/II